MGHEARRNGTDIFQDGQRFTKVNTAKSQAPPPQQATAGIPGYANLGPDEAGIQETLFIPVCRRVQILPPPGLTPEGLADRIKTLAMLAEARQEPFEMEGETVRVLIENGEWVEYGPLQSKQLLRRTGMRAVKPESDSLILIPDKFRPEQFGLGK